MQYKFWIALQQSNGIGISSIKDIYNTINSLNLSISDLFSLDSTELKNEFNFNQKIINGFIEAKKTLDKIEDEYYDLVDAGIRPLLFFEKNFPGTIKDKLQGNTPPILYTYGDLDSFNLPACAILGDPDASPKSEMIAYSSAKQLVSHKISVISGMTKGIGTIAHRSAIENGGKTIAVLPCGILKFKLNKSLQEIYHKDKFLIISQFYPQELISEYNAYIRNRLICALSKAVYIVETKTKSGLMESAKSAIKVNTPLYTTEYSEYNSKSSGNLELFDKFNSNPVRGRKTGNTVEPNMDQIISICKFK